MIYSNNTNYIIDKLFDNINRKIADFIRGFCSKNVYFLYGRRITNRLLLHYLLLLYHNIFLLSSILYDFFGIISNFILRFQSSLHRRSASHIHCAIASRCLVVSRLRRLA